MNGRMYDPYIGSFLSPDIYVQAPDATMGLNRYSYALGNPLAFTDPSGYAYVGAGYNGTTTSGYRMPNEEVHTQLWLNLWSNPVTAESAFYGLMGYFGGGGALNGVITPAMSQQMAYNSASVALGACGIAAGTVLHSWKTYSDWQGGGYFETMEANNGATWLIGGETGSKVTPHTITMGDVLDWISKNSFIENAYSQSSNAMIINMDDNYAFVRPESDNPQITGASWLIPPGQARNYDIDAVATQLYKDKVFKISNSLIGYMVIINKGGEVTIPWYVQGEWKTFSEIENEYGAYPANWENIFESAETGSFNMTQWWNKPDWWGN
ncbi:MAG: hypothetical protein KKA07_05120 [Bacteroidetes bacterium]|nr:hypothetical protein [Bacteroidota bacterium]